MGEERERERAIVTSYLVVIAMLRGELPSGQTGTVTA